MRANRLLVLGWHNIEGTPSYPRTTGQGARGFARQVAWLSRWASPVRLHDALARLAAGRPLPSRAVALTFDDGYRDNATTAVPILKRAGVPATFFLVSGFLDRRWSPWWEDLATAWSAVPDAGGPLGSWTVPPRGPDRARALNAAQHDLKRVDSASRVRAVTAAMDAAGTAATASTLMMDWGEARHLVDEGFDIGSHTDSHPILSRDSPEDQQRELAESARALDAGLPRTVPVLAYPNGGADDLDATTMAAARDTGYGFAVTTVWGVNGRRTDPFAVRRILVQPSQTLRNLRWDLPAQPWRMPHRRP